MNPTPPSDSHPHLSFHSHPPSISPGGFRAQYNTHGVSSYYTQVATSYRNPHFPGVQKCIHICLDRIFSCHGDAPQGIDLLSFSPSHPLSIFDLAAGSGEATVSVVGYLKKKRPEWFVCHVLESAPERCCTVLGNDASLQSPLPQSLPRPPAPVPAPVPLSHPAPLQILACDPFTSTLYTKKTNLPCTTHTFKHLTHGLEPLISDFQTAHHCDSSSIPPSSPSTLPKQKLKFKKTIDITICSFALHLVPEGTGELWGLLYALSLRSKWLVVVAPHKKPEIDQKGGMGWEMVGEEVVVKEERVRGRVFRSLNFEEAEAEDGGGGGVGWMEKERKWENKPIWEQKKST